jgi:hypothetical protein
MDRTSESELVYFFHIPKTSGTSLHQSLLTAYGSEAVSPHLLWDDLVNGTYEPSERTRVITGHLGGLLPLWLRRWPRIVTMLRDPIARAVSHINEVQRYSGHPLHSLAAGLSVGEYCEHPVLRRTVDNFMSRYLASLDFALVLMPSTSDRRGQESYASVSVAFEDAFFALDKETGLYEGAIRALDAIDAVGICEVHSTSLRLFARALGWDAGVPEFRRNPSTDQRTVQDLTEAEIEILTSLNLIDAQVYDHAVKRFLYLCSQYGLELKDCESSALTQSSSREPRKGSGMIRCDAYAPSDRQRRRTLTEWGRVAARHATSLFHTSHGAD